MVERAHGPRQGGTVDRDACRCCAHKIEGLRTRRRDDCHRVQRVPAAIGVEDAVQVGVAVADGVDVRRSVRGVVVGRGGIGRGRGVVVLLEDGSEVVRIVARSPLHRAQRNGIHVVGGQCGTQVPQRAGKDQAVVVHLADQVIRIPVVWRVDVASGVAALAVRRIVGDRAAEEIREGLVHRAALFRAVEVHGRSLVNGMDDPVCVLVVDDVGAQGKILAASSHATAEVQSIHSRGGIAVRTVADAHRQGIRLHGDIERRTPQEPVADAIDVIERVGLDEVGRRIVRRPVPVVRAGHGDSGCVSRVGIGGLVVLHLHVRTREVTGQGDHAGGKARHVVRTCGVGLGRCRERALRNFHFHVGNRLRRGRVRRHVRMHETRHRAMDRFVLDHVAALEDRARIRVHEVAPLHRHELPEPIILGIRLRRRHDASIRRLLHRHDDLPREVVSDPLAFAARRNDELLPHGANSGRPCCGQGGLQRHPRHDGPLDPRVGLGPRAHDLAVGDDEAHRSAQHRHAAVGLLISDIPRAGAATGVLRRLELGAGEHEVACVDQQDRREPGQELARPGFDRLAYQSSRERRSVAADECRRPGQRIPLHTPAVAECRVELREAANGAIRGDAPAMLSCTWLSWCCSGSAGSTSTHGVESPSAGARTTSRTCPGGRSGSRLTGRRPPRAAGTPRLRGPPPRP